MAAFKILKIKTPYAGERRLRWLSEDERMKAHRSADPQPNRAHRRSRRKTTKWLQNLLQVIPNTDNVKGYIEI
jgi:hypothetical protein